MFTFQSEINSRSISFICRDQQRIPRSSESGFWRPSQYSSFYWFSYSLIVYTQTEFQNPDTQTSSDPGTDGYTRNGDTIPPTQKQRNNSIESSSESLLRTLTENNLVRYLFRNALYVAGWVAVCAAIVYYVYTFISWVATTMNKNAKAIGRKILMTCMVSLAAHRLLMSWNISWEGLIRSSGNGVIIQKTSQTTQYITSTFPFYSCIVGGTILVLLMVKKC